MERAGVLRNERIIVKVPCKNLRVSSPLWKWRPKKRKIYRLDPNRLRVVDFRRFRQVWREPATARRTIMGNLWLPWCCTCRVNGSRKNRRKRTNAKPRMRKRKQAVQTKTTTERRQRTPGLLLVPRGGGAKERTKKAPRRRKPPIRNRKLMVYDYLDHSIRCPCEQYHYGNLFRVKSDHPLLKHDVKSTRIFTLWWCVTFLSCREKILPEENDLEQNDDDQLAWKSFTPLCTSQTRQPLLFLQLAK
mmetsp:Transcript_12026/g.23009  ORF Transcript_12026/g.23009 Transcript_12026/m.23009 type:complete len:246 (+) Transcript_12026:180-917(+)